MLRALLVVIVASQGPPVRRITAAEVEFSESFTIISAIRELRDGRVLVADARDKTLQLVDFEHGTAVKVGREGAGPGEFGLPSRLIPLPGDSTLLHDPVHARLLLILPSGAAGPTFRIDEMDVAQIGAPRAADAMGKFFFYQVSRPPEPGGRFQSSRVDILRFDRTRRRADTVTTLQLPEELFTGASSMPGGMLRTYTNKPLAPEDVAAYAPDGRVAVVRARDYRVEWFLPDGTRRAGMPIAYDRIKVTPEEKEAFRASQTRPGNIIVRGPTGSGGTPTAGAPRSAPIPRGADPFADHPEAWPATKPAFPAGAASVAPDGRLWVLKSRAHTDPAPLFDIFDAAGNLVERIALPARSRLVGFGNGVVYLARTDDDDLQWLGRYRVGR